MTEGPGRLRRIAALALCALLLAPPAPAPAGPARLADLDARHLDRVHESIKRLSARIRALDARVGELETALEAARRAQDAALTPTVEIDGRPVPAERRSAAATVIRTASGGRRPAVARLGDEALAARCADADGCLATLGLSGIATDGRPLEAAVTLGPCALHLAPDSGGWTVSAGCVPGTGETGARGRDGDAARLGAAQTEARVLIDLAGACLLTESAPSRRRVLDGAPRLEVDRTRGLHLIATTPEWHLDRPFPEDLLPPGTRFDCRLTLRD